MADRQCAGPRYAGQRAHAEAGLLVAAVMKDHIRVVLADDHPVVRDGLVAMVNQQADMEVVGEAGDGEEAMVLDLRMPKRDGVAVVQRVLEINPKACILIMTTYDGDEDIFQCLSQGAKGYLLKDAPRQEILSAIRAVSEDRPYTSSTVAAKALQRMAKPSLTQRELAVLQLVAEGRSNKDIARRLSITEGTAKTHVKAILTKLDAISRTEAVAVAHPRGLIHLEGPGRGALAPALGQALVQVWMRRPPPKDQFSQAVSLKHTITCSAFTPTCVRFSMSSASSFFFTLTLRPTDQRISMSRKSALRALSRSGYAGSKRKSASLSSRTRWNLSAAGTPDDTSAACTASSTATLNSTGLGLRTVSVTSGMASPCNCPC